MASRVCNWLHSNGEKEIVLCWSVITFEKKKSFLLFTSEQIFSFHFLPHTAKQQKKLAKQNNSSVYTKKKNKFKKMLSKEWRRRKTIRDSKQRNREGASWQKKSYKFFNILKIQNDAHTHNRSLASFISCVIFFLSSFLCFVKVSKLRCCYLLYFHRYNMLPLLKPPHNSKAFICQ